MKVYLTIKKILKNNLKFEFLNGSYNRKSQNLKILKNNYTKILRKC